MPSVTFSLTENIIINPVLYMRAELLNDPESPHGIGKKAWHFIEAEVLARITAIFTSLFAAADSIVHFLTGCCKGAYLLLGKCCHIQTSNKSEVYEHFYRAALFSGITLIGTIAGTIWPGVVKYFKQPKPNTFNDENISDLLPGTIDKLTKDVLDGKEGAPFTQLGSFWRRSNLADKSWFVQAFNQDKDIFKSVRQKLADVVYRPIVSLGKRQVQWLNDKEVSTKVNRAWERTNTFSKAFFFHATSEKALESILKSKKVEVRHEKAYRGAFVSTQPELSFGRCVLAFKRNIERLSPLNHGFTINNPETYWAGFSRDIPVDGNTLAYIILNSRDEEERQVLEIECEKWAGRKVDVILTGHVLHKLDAVQDLYMGIPQEWPEEGESAGQTILKAIKLTPQPVPKELTIPTSVAQTAVGQPERRQLLAVEY